MKKLLFVCAIISTSCSSPTVMDPNFEIIINDDQSYKYDLNKQLYTIYFMSKLPREIKFDLTKEEKNKILNLYYTLKIDKISGISKVTGNIYIEDKCTTMPKSFTMLHIRKGNLSQEIQIDEDCNTFVLSNYIEANRVKQFLKKIRDILQSKPEIRNAPESDIIYM